MHDYTHVARLVEMVDNLRAGQFPVVWSADFGYGYGMPLFLFYGPLPFYLASIPTLLGLPALLSIKLLIFLTHVLAWLGMYSLMKRWGRVTGFVAATIFVLAPYRALDLYVRGALNELFALSLLPWILHFAWLTLQDKRVAWLGLSISTAALITTHNLTAFMALPILFALSLVWILLHPKDWIKNVVLVTLGYFTGAALSAFYAVPAYILKDQTIIGEITSGYFDFRLHFLYIRQFFQVDWGFGGSAYGPDDDISFHFGYLSIWLAALGGLATGWQLIKTWLHRQDWQTWFWRHRTRWLFLITSGFTSLSLFLTIFKSQWVWEAIPLLSFIQFPWRFLAIANVLVAMLAGWGIWSIKPRFWRWALAWIVSIAVIISQLRWQQPQEYLSRNEDFYYTDRQLIRTNMSSILSDYLPLGFDQKLPVVEPNERITLQAEDTTSRWETNEPQELLLFTQAPSGGTITWNIADFPGWKYFVNDVVIEPYALSDGRRQWVTDQPIQTIGAQYQPTPLQMYSNTVSVIALIVWLAVLLPKPKSKVEYVRE